VVGVVGVSVDEDDLGGHRPQPSVPVRRVLGVGVVGVGIG
jgi:hypothetical protein